MTTGFLMGYGPSATITSIGAGYGPLVDHTYGRVFQFGPGSKLTAGAGIDRYDAYPNGVELLARLQSDMNPPAEADGSNANVNPPQTFLFNAQQLAFSAGSSNSSTIEFVRARELSWVKRFGITSGSLAASGQFRALAADVMCAIQNSATGTDYVVFSTIVSGGEINLLNCNKLVNTRLGTVNESQANCGAAPDGSGSIAYVLGRQASAIGIYTAAPIDYPSPSGTLTRLAGYTPAQIDAQWTQFTGWAGPAVDLTDGHLIIGLITTDAAPANKSYLLKINSTTGAIIWQRGLGGSGGMQYSKYGLQRCLIKNQRLHYLGGESPPLLHNINTSTGVDTTQTLDTATLHVLYGDQLSEDVSDSIYWFGSWTENTTHPAYIGTYCFTQGHHSGTATTWRYFSGASVSVPTPPPPAASRKRAWTFTLDGHVFYVLDLGNQGTFAYDVTTSQWSKFITKGYLQWNFANGTMFNNRIVGGDIDTIDIWEMQPGALLDNGSIDISHAVTGALVKRTRVYSSVESARLAVSAGILDDNATATVTLAYSDDQGQTYVTLDTFVLTGETTSDEIAWRSIGSFSAPGRVFLVTDVGGFVRIDGLDAYLDNFDDDQPPEQQGG